MTSSLKYAEQYALLSSKQTPALVIAAVIPGNSHPVIEPIYLRDSSNGKFIPKTDAQGKIVYRTDKAGNMVYKDPPSTRKTLSLNM